MTFFTLATGLVPASLLVLFRSRKHQPSLFLAFLLLSLSAYASYWNQNFWPILMPGRLAGTLTGGAIFLAGPALYRYINSLEQQPQSFSRLWPHLVPFLLYLAFESLSGPNASSALTTRFPGLFVLEFIRELAVRQLHFICGPLLFLGYVLWSCKQNWGEEAGPQRKNMTWPMVLQGLLCLFATVSIALVFQVNLFQKVQMSGQVNGPLPYFFILAFLALATSIFYFPEVLYGAILLPENYETASLKQESPKARTAKMESDYLQEIGTTIKSYMENEQGYLDPNLTLPRFSVLTNIPAHPLAYYFRTEKKLSFTEYRNLWRVRHAKTMISEGYAAFMTLEAIGEQSGFTSRGTFLSAFKKQEGISPKEFMQQYMPSEEDLGTKQKSGFLMPSIPTIHAQGNH